MPVCPSQVDVAKVLLLAGADAHARDHRSRCPLHMAALSGNSELVTSLLTCGADPNKASDVGTTALHNAVSTRQSVLVCCVVCGPHRRFKAVLVFLSGAAARGNTRIAPKIPVLPTQQQACAPQLLYVCTLGSDFFSWLARVGPSASLLTTLYPFSVFSLSLCPPHLLVLYRRCWDE